MLFDLQGKRRRLVQAVYLMLAVLMGGGLVLFGIGGDVSGGLFDAFSDRSNSGNDVVEERVEKSEEQPGLLGLAFEPVRDRRIPDIRGVLWLSARSAELRFVEFDYTGMSLPEPAANGGRVEYERLPGGAWIGD